VSNEIFSDLHHYLMAQTQEGDEVVVQSAKVARKEEKWD
jgi:hypothetical protein